MSTPTPAQDMRDLHPTEREILIIYGILAGVVIDARARFPKQMKRGVLR